MIILTYKHINIFKTKGMSCKLASVQSDNYLQIGRKEIKSSGQRPEPTRR